MMASDSPREERNHASAIVDPTLQLLKGDWQCTCCGQWFHGILDLAAGAPDFWPHVCEYEPNDALRTDGDFLSSDFCVINGRHFMVRAIMIFPIVGTDDVWTLGCWSSLSRENFETYATAFANGGALSDAGPWFGWLCNGIKGFSTLDDNVSLDVHPQEEEDRPHLIARDEDNPVARAQRDGLTPDQLLAILRANGHGPTPQ